MSNGAKVSLIGRLTKEPTQKPWQGSSVVSFSVAVSTTKKEGDKYLSDFYNVSVWGKSGEYIMSRIQKGMLVYVCGDLTLQAYKDKNGVERQSLSVRASDVIVLEKKNNNSSPSNDDDDGPVPF